MAKRNLKMDIINPNAAGIDIGSRSHFVAINQEHSDVKEFGVYAQDIKELLKWLLENDVKTVAMESTGSYWQNLYTELQNSSIEVILTNGKFTKNIKGKKTDVLDCMWIQRLHTLGLLSGSFLPDLETEHLRTLVRHRGNLIQTTSKASKRMAQNMRLMNLRLDIVVKDIVGLTGLRIINKICNGETSGKELAKLRHGNCKKSEEEIAKALQSNNRQDYLFVLKQELQKYQDTQKLIIECDIEIKNILEQFVNQNEIKKSLYIDKKVHKRINKNTPKNIDLNLISYQYFDGVDLYAIEGFSHGTVLTLMSELGEKGILKFQNAQHFTSWLRLAPNNKISGGRILSSRTPKGSNRLKIALRQAANAIGNLKDTHLSNFFNRIAYRKGRAVAVSATARKIATILWNMLYKNIQYTPPTIYEYLDQKRKRKVLELQKQIANLDARMSKIQPV
ncbi:transposase IS116/IS110/IS902 family protein [Aquimarina sp. MAR_2010_214]|uniref:IS110 family transposase n=1 Tax=Aquimarina sp. MAR_2010_214 TaxID=1250026 RepID=UPI000C7115BF|nr:IS110 family transposase [Aquimarina sp. MAR_2010_214]PKV48846.1 transposase IS116/IS110/IS902 family protein [Aquimarina sp. MAR_2010_214]PKV50340.1 transposase IS116/IS110/IS902 family protein [Aquimarina sp. MAR_2010_214]